MHLNGGTSCPDSLVGYLLPMTTQNPKQHDTVRLQQGFSKALQMNHILNEHVTDIAHVILSHQDLLGQ